jgi:hypothetical protein
MTSPTPVVIHADALAALWLLGEGTVDAIVTDPPYEMGFMGKRWDGTGIAYSVELWRECLRVLKPGGHLAAFGGTRTYHRMACAVEDAGFEIRDGLTWLYGSGFPKSLDIGKAIDKAAGAVREVLGANPNHRAVSGVDYEGIYQGGNTGSSTITAPATDAARTWQGWGTALKPAQEPIVLARKPLAGTVAGNVLAHGTGGLNIDATRVGTSKDVPASPRRAVQGPAYGDLSKDPGTGSGWDRNVGRWPSNVVLSHAPECGADDDPQPCPPGCAVAELDAQSEGTRAAKASGTGSRSRSEFFGLGVTEVANRFNDSGGASRFFPVFRYQAKAPTRERPKVDGISHPTVKPLALMRWLVRLLTPPGGVVLDLFAGSGTTLRAARDEGMRSIGIECEADYLPLIDLRLGLIEPPALPVPDADAQPSPVDPAEWAAAVEHDKALEET